MPPSPVPAPVAEELGRLGVRWQQLALPEAVSRLPAVRAVIEALAGEPVPDLGPAVVIDQLTVVVFDACAATHDRADLLSVLVGLRRAL